MVYIDVLNDVVIYADGLVIYAKPSDYQENTRVMQDLQKTIKGLSEDPQEASKPVLPALGGARGGR